MTCPRCHMNFVVAATVYSTLRPYDECICGWRRYFRRSNPLYWNSQGKRYRRRA